MSRFVQRDGVGAVVNHFANAQLGYAMEEIADDHADLITWVVEQVGTTDKYSWGNPVIEFVKVAFVKPGAFFTQGNYTTNRVGNVITVTRLWTAWTQVEINAYMSGVRDSVIAQLDNVEDLLRAFANVVLDEFNLHSTRLESLLNAIKNNATYTPARTAIQAIAAIPQRNLAQIRPQIRNKLGT